MDYNAQHGMLELEKKAILEKNKNRFSSEHILYDTLKDIVKAGPPPRVKITIHPEQNSEQPPLQQKSTEEKSPESGLQP